MSQASGLNGMGVVRRKGHVVSTSVFIPLHALCRKAGGAQCFLDVGEPLGGFQLAQPAVHVVGRITANLHQFDEAFLKSTASGLE